jgi:serine protease
VVTTTGSTSASNDEDLYVKQGSHPTASSYNCRSWNYGSNEQCTINNPAAGTWYVLIRGYTAYSGVTLEADWN